MSSENSAFDPADHPEAFPAIATAAGKAPGQSDVRDEAIEAMAAAMRPVLGGDWIKFKGGEGIAALALRALLPHIADALRLEGEAGRELHDDVERFIAIIERDFGGQV